MKNRDLDVGHGVAVFIDNPAGDNCRRQHPKNEIIQFLAGIERYGCPKRAPVVLPNFNESGPLDENAVTSRAHIIDGKMSVLVGHGGVIERVLIFGNDLHSCLLQRFAALILHYGALKAGFWLSACLVGKGFQAGTEDHGEAEAQ